jgi:hypothetical protein
MEACVSDTAAPLVDAAASNSNIELHVILMILLKYHIHEK